jgi:hypothetical protein
MMTINSLLAAGSLPSKSIEQTAFTDLGRGKEMVVQYLEVQQICMIVIVWTLD